MPYSFSDNNNDYEDLYATLKTLPRAPSPPAPGAPGPPLPPRNDTLRPGTQTLALRALDSAIGRDLHSNSVRNFDTTDYFLVLDVFLVL